MRFAVSPADPRFHALVVALDQEGTPMAETWRAVGNAAEELGLLRPGYHMVRVLVRSVRAVRGARAQLRRAALGVLASFPSPYVVHLRRALDELHEAYERERLVLEQHKPP
ncbi:MAG TPA: hypothetical protein VNT23_05115 [Gaiellaceae bacterium]|nr:hypothetical protein [Gaiellaceae bacterium]